MVRRLPGRTALAVAALPLLVPTARLGAADGTGTTDHAPALRDLVRSLGDGTVLGPTMDAIARVGPDALWTDLSVVLLGGTGVMLVTFGPILLAVAFHWTYRRLRWLAWGAVRALRRGGSAIARLALRVKRASPGGDGTGPTRERASGGGSRDGDGTPAD